MDWVAVVAGALWAMLPAYVPNNAAVVFGGGPPVDAGRTLDGRRLLGDGKTWRGTAAGVAVGVLLAGALNLARPAVAGLLGADLVAFTAIVLGLQTLFGAFLMSALGGPQNGISGPSE